MAQKVIDAAEADRFEPWQPPPVGGREAEEAARAEGPQLPTVEEIEAISRAAHEEGYQAGFEEGRAAGFEAGRAEGHAQGLEEGRAQGLAELRARGEELARLLDALDHPFEHLDEQVAEELAALAMIVARHLVRRELKTDSGVVVSVVREAVALLPASARRIRVFLHPEDAALVRQALSVDDEDGEELRWRIVEEPTLTRGGCRVESEDSRIDATVEARLGALIARALGGEREEDAASAGPASTPEAVAGGQGAAPEAPPEPSSEPPSEVTSEAGPETVFEADPETDGATAPGTANPSPPPPTNDDGP